MTEAKQVLDDLFLFDPAIGFFNRTSRGRAKDGERAGYVDVHGYRRICVGYNKFYEHHLVWFYVHGQWPDEIDHKNGDRSDNAIENLRLCDRSQNNFNNKQLPGASGLRGVYLDKRAIKWYSKIQIRGQVIYLGTFATAIEAHRAFLAAAERYHGDFRYEQRTG